jgi:hypothetical protein
VRALPAIVAAVAVVAGCSDRTRYDDATDITRILSQDVQACAASEPHVTVVSVSAQECGYGDGEYFAADVYARDTEEGVAYLAEVNPTLWWVVGENWSVGVTDQDMVEPVADALGGKAWEQ